MMSYQDDLFANPSDIKYLLPIPTKKSNHVLYSWAYHRFESMANRLKMEDREQVLMLCRAKANRVVSLYGK